MAEKRSVCRAAAQSLSAVIGFEIQNSEVAGIRVTELDTLAYFYKTYEELITTINTVLSSTISEGQADSLPIAELQKLSTKAQPLKLLPSFANLQERTRHLIELREIARKWSEYGIGANLIQEIDESMSPDPSLAALLDSLKNKSERLSNLMKFAVSEKQARELISQSESLYSLPASDKLRNSSSLVETKESLGLLIPSTSSSFEGRAHYEWLCSTIESLFSTKFIVGETEAMAAYSDLSVLGSDSIAKLHACVLAVEGIKRDAGLTVRDFAKKYPTRSVSTLQEDLKSVRSQLSGLCEKARRMLPILNTFTDADVVRLSAVSNVDSADGKASVSKLFPMWQALIVAERGIEGIRSLNGETLTFGNPVSTVAADGYPLRFLDVIPLVLSEQSRTIETLTLEAHRLAHHICIGKAKFSPEAVLNMPSQVAVRFLLFLWTELCEGALGGGSRLNFIPGVPTVAGLDGEGMASQSLRRIGAESRGPSRPTSAASRHSQSRISSPRKSLADDPRPGSASTTLFRKAAKGDDRLKLSQLSTAELFDVSLAKPSTTSSARTRRIEASNAAIMAVVPSPNSISPSSPAAVSGAKLRAQSSIASRARLPSIFRGFLELLQQRLAASALTESEMSKLCSLIQWQHRFLTSWETQVSKAVSAEDFLWRREPRLYVASNTQRVVFQQSETSLCVEHFFIPIADSFALGSVDQQAWRHLSLMRSIKRPTLFYGHEHSIAAFSSICGLPTTVITASEQLPANSPPLAASPSTDKSRQVGRGAKGVPVKSGAFPTTKPRLLLAIYQPEDMSAVDQENIAHWLAEHGGEEDVIILCRPGSEERVHSFIRTHASPFFAPPADAGSLCISVERVLFSAGITDTSCTIVERLTSFLMVSRDLVGWDIPLSLLHLSVVTITAALKEGVSIDVALRKSVFNTLLARAPLAAFPSLVNASRTTFGSVKETMYYPQLTQTIALCLEENGLTPSAELGMKCKVVYEFLSGPSDGMLIVRGEAKVGKLSLVKSAVAVLGLLDGPIKTVTTVWSEDMINSMPASADLVLSLNFPEKSIAALTKLRSSARKVIIVSDDAELPTSVACDGGVKVILIEPRPYSSHVVSVRESFGEGVASSVERLLGEHAAAMVAMASACDASNPSTHARVITTLVSLMRGYLGKLSDSENLNAVERCFWVAATWACVPSADPAWIEFSSARMPEELIPSPDLFSCCVLPSGEWGLWTADPSLPKGASYHSIPACRAAALMNILLDSGESVYIQGSSAKAVAQAAGLHEPQDGRVYARREKPTLWYVESLPSFVSLPVVVVHEVLTVADCAAIEGALCGPFSSLAVPYPRCASLGALAVAQQVHGTRDSVPLASNIVGMLAKARLMPSHHSTVDALLECEGSCAVVIGAGKASVLALTEAADTLDASPGEARLIHSLALMMCTAAPSCVITAPSGCSDVVGSALLRASALVSKGLSVSNSVPHAASPRSISVFRPSSGELPSLEDVRAALSMGVIVDVSSTKMDDAVVSSLLAIGLTFQYEFTAEDQHYLLEKAARSVPKSGLAVLVDLIPKNTVSPSVFRAALALAQRVRESRGSYGATASATSRQSARSLKKLEQTLQSKGRNVASDALTSYTVPADHRADMLLFEGQTSFKDYPHEPLRLMMLPRYDGKGALKEYSHVSVCVGSPHSNVVHVPSSDGGQCRARLDNGGGLIISAPPYELRLVPTAHSRKVDGTAGEGDGAATPASAPAFTGTLSEVGRGTVQLGDVELVQVEGDASVEWLRGVESNHLDEDQVEGGGLRGSDAGAPDRAEERERMQASVASSVKTALRLADEKLRESHASAQTADHFAVASAVLVVSSMMTSQARTSFVEKVQNAYSQGMHGSLPDPFARDVACAFVGETRSALSLWLSEQQSSKLPNGTHGEHVAILVRVLKVCGLSPAMFDPTGVFTDWGAGLGVPVLSSDAALPPASINGEHTVASLAAAFGSTASPLTSADGPSLSAAVDQENVNHNVITTFMNESNGLSTDELLEYLSNPSTTQLLSQVASVTESPSSSPSTKRGTIKAVGEREPASAPFRLAALVFHCARLLPLIQPIYGTSLKELMGLAEAALQAQATTKSSGGQSSVDLAVKSFGSLILSRVLQEDRLLLSAGMAMAVLIEEKRADSSVFGIVLRLLRNVDPSTIDASNAAFLEAANNAFAEWQRSQESSRARRKETKELKDFIDPKMMPSYPFISQRQWSNVLCLAEAVPALASLPQALQHGDLPKGATKQDRWTEWLDTCIGPLPTFEKSATLTPLDQLLVVLALRPSKLVVALLQFVVETLGSDFPDPYALEDPIPTILQASRGSQKRAVIIHSHLAAPQAIQQTIVAAAKAFSLTAAPTTSASSPSSPSRGGASEKNTTAPSAKSPFVYVESALFPHRVKEAIASACKTNDWVLVEDCEKATPTMLLSLLRAKLPEAYKGTVFFSTAPNVPMPTASTLLNSVPRVTCNFTWSLRMSMSHHYMSLRAQKIALSDANHRLIFVTAFLVSALEQRSRFGNLGLTSAQRFYACERDMTAAISAVLHATSAAPTTNDSSEGSKVSPHAKRSHGRVSVYGESSAYDITTDTVVTPGSGSSIGISWDSLRDQLFVVLSSLASNNRDRAIVQAYIDWLIHPQVVNGESELGNGVVIPSDPTYESHFSTIAQLPDATSTEMIGLNTGVELQLREQESERIFTFLEDTFIPTPSPEEVEAFAEQVLSALPTPSTLAIARDYELAASSDMALPSALMREWTHLKKTLSCLRSDLLGVLSKPCEWQTVFVQQRVPKSWGGPTDAGHGSMQGFIASLQGAHEQLAQWSALNGAPPKALTACAFSNIKRFLAACCHDSASLLGLPISHVVPILQTLNSVPDFIPEMLATPSAPITEGFVFLSVEMVGTLVDRKGMLQELFEHAIYWWQMPNTAIGGVRVTFGPSEEATGAPLRRGKAFIPTTRPSTAFHNSTARQQHPSITPSPSPSSPALLSTSASTRDVLQERRTSVSKRGVFLAPFYTTSSQREEDLVGYVPVECFEDHNYWVLRGAAVVGSL